MSSLPGSSGRKAASKLGTVTIIAFIGPTDAFTVRETPEEILKTAEG
jgi:hypothetical protein